MRHGAPNSPTSHPAQLERPVSTQYNTITVVGQSTHRARAVMWVDERKEEGGEREKRRG